MCEIYYQDLNKLFRSENIIHADLENMSEADELALYH